MLQSTSSPAAGSLACFPKKRKNNLNTDKMQQQKEKKFPINRLTNLGEHADVTIDPLLLHVLGLQVQTNPDQATGISRAKAVIVANLMLLEINRD
jgi:hypothetical protein